MGPKKESWHRCASSPFCKPPRAQGRGPRDSTFSVGRNQAEIKEEEASVELRLHNSRGLN